MTGTFFFHKFKLLSWVALSSVFIISPLTTARASSSGLCSGANVDFVLNESQRQTVVDIGTFYQLAKQRFSQYQSGGNHYAGTDAILNYWNTHRELKDIRWLGYILATAYHETAYRMYPVRETLASTDESAISRLENYYQKRQSGPVYWRPVDETGKGYFGRGYVQLTWDYNYKRADLRFGIDNTQNNPDSYYWNPSLALDPDDSIRITYDGMVYGWYTGHCLLRHFQPNVRGDYREARRIINGLDRADDIGEHAIEFVEILEASEVPISSAP